MINVRYNYHLGYTYVINIFINFCFSRLQRERERERERKKERERIGEGWRKRYKAGDVSILKVFIDGMKKMQLQDLQHHFYTCMNEIKEDVISSLIFLRNMRRYEMYWQFSVNFINYSKVCMKSKVLITHPSVWIPTSYFHWNILVSFKFLSQVLTAKRHN